MSARDEDRAGYAQPPVQHQFQKGKSGNPKGRPRKSPAETMIINMDANSAEIILEEARRTVPVRENGKVVDMTTARALSRQLNVTALRGSPRAQIEALKLISAAEQFLAHSKNSPRGNCRCAEFAEMTDEELYENMRDLLDSGRVHLPDGYELVNIPDDDDHSDLA